MPILTRGRQAGADAPATGRRQVRDAVGARRMLMRTELTALASCIAAFTFFAITAGSEGFLSVTSLQNSLETAADIGILAAPATLLLVAGEFDLTVGAMVGLSEIAVSYPVVYLHWPLLPAVLLAVGIACVVGLINGFLIVKVGLPSLIVTLAGYFWIAGVAQGITQSLTSSTIIDNVRQALPGDWLLPVFSKYVFKLPPDLWWWLLVTIVAAWVLHATKFGNWNYATGGDVESAKRAGVKTDRVKMVLYVASAVSTVIVAALSTFAINEGNVTDGSSYVFEVVAAVVIGGGAVTGGFGSPVGTLLGALLFGLVEEGFYFTDIASIWYQAFVGFALIAAVIVNTYVRRIALRPVRGDD